MACEPHLRHPVLNSTVVDNMNSSSLESILEDDLWGSRTRALKTRVLKTRALKDSSPKGHDS